MDNYQIQQQLNTHFLIGSKVLRVTQISGWVTSEVKRRKDAALAAAADVVNMAKKAAEKGAEVDLSGVFEAHRDKVLGSNLDDSEVTPERLKRWKTEWRNARSTEWQEAAEAAQTQKREEQERKQAKQRKQLEKMKEKEQHKKRKESKKQLEKQPANKKQKKQKSAAAMVEKQQLGGPSGRTANGLSLLPGQAWCKCCGAAVARTELDKEEECKDQTDKSECLKRREERGKRKRAPRDRI